MLDPYVIMYYDDEETTMCLTEDNEWLPEYLLDSWYSFKYELRSS